MIVDLTDTTFAASSTGDLDGHLSLDLTGTMFKFMDGEKKTKLEMNQSSVRLQVDNESLLDKY